MKIRQKAVGIADYLSWVLVRSLVWVMEKAPDAVALAIAKFIVHTVLFFIPRASRVGHRNLQLVFPVLSEGQRQQLLSASYDMLARTLVGFSKMPLLSLEKVRATFDFTEMELVIAKARENSNGKGVIFATGHFGSFELMSQAHALVCRPGAVLARGFGLPRLDAWWNARRESFGNTVFERKGGYQKVERYLKEGRDVCILFDQNIKQNHAVFVDLFGIKAATTKAVALAALRVKAAIVFAVAAEYSPGNYRVIAKNIPLSSNEQESIEEKVERITRTLNQCLEEVVREYPDHWLWIHRRFKTRPPGEPETIY